MSNHFPTPPGTWLIKQLVYTVSSTYPGNNFGPVSSTALDFTPGVNSSFDINQSVSTVDFQFSTPGTVGSFDQDTAETQIKAEASSFAASLVNLYGDTLANVKATISISRSWTWVGSGGYVLTLTDTVTYP